MITAKGCAMDLKTNSLLPAIGFAAGLTADARACLCEFGRFADRPVGSFLAKQGRPHHAMSLLLSGRVSVSVAAHGDHVELGLLSAGDVVGEMSLIDPQVASATARVVEGPARLWIIERVAFDRFVAQDSATGSALYKALGKVLCKRVRADSELMLRKAEEMRSHLLDMDY